MFNPTALEPSAPRPPQTPQSVIAEERLRRLFGDNDVRLRLALVATPNDAERLDRIRLASDGSRLFLVVVTNDPDQVPPIKDGGCADDFLFEIATKVRQNGIATTVAAYDGRTWHPPPTGHEKWQIWNPGYGPEQIPIEENGPVAIIWHHGAAIDAVAVAIDEMDP